MILVFLLLSGCCGLIYEILWMRALTLIIGNTVFSITTVLTAFMGGLALGSFLAGRLLDRIKNPLRTYALLEGGIGLYALLLPFLIQGTEPLFRLVYDDTSFYALNLLRFLICGALLLIPTTLMGATLPVLCKHFSERSAEPGWTVGLLYGLNTCGAVLGSGVAGFFLLPALGMTGTLMVAAFLNIGIAVGVWVLYRDDAPGEPQRMARDSGARRREGMREPEIEPGAVSPVTLVVMTGIGLSGVAAMIYQVAWMRVLSLSIGSSVYAFSLIVTAFISGLALGSLCIGKLIDRRRDWVLGLASVEALIGVSALLIVPVLGTLPIFMIEVVSDYFSSFRHLLLVELAIVFVLLLAPTFLMGAAVPLATRICTTDHRRLGRIFGDVYAVNTLGAIIGTVVAGFFLMPWLGTQNSILVAVALNLAAAGLLYLWAPTLSVRRRVAVACTILMVGAVAPSRIPSWDSMILTSGPYLYADVYRDLSTRMGQGVEAAMGEGRQLLFFKEGYNAVVSVEKTPQGDLALEINGKTDATARGDAATQLMLGHLPLLLHPEAGDVLVIGLGSGMTLGAVERYPVRAVDVVELEPAVVEASTFFTEYTGDVLDDPRVNLILADGRTHLALTGREYDVIISEPTNTWIAGVANLFTHEFFELAKRRLRPGGVLCQWLHAYSMSSDDFKTIVHTFNESFPHTTVWEVDLGNDYLLLGSMEELRIDSEELRDRLSRDLITADRRRMHLSDTFSLIGRLLLAGEGIGQFAQGAPIHTDDNAILEYSAPRALLENRSTALLEDLYRFRADPAGILKTLGWIGDAGAAEGRLREVLRAKRYVMAGFVDFALGAERGVIDNFERALAIDPGNYEAAYLLARHHYETGERLEETEHPSAARGAYEQSTGAADRFVAGSGILLSDHSDLEVIHAQAQLRLGVIHLKSKRPAEAAEALRRSLAGGVKLTQAHTNLGVALEGLGRYEEAGREYRRALEINPNQVSARMNLANIDLNQSRFRAAIDGYHQVQEQRPDFPMAHYNLGVAYFKQEEWARAEREWERALDLDPDFTQARRSLEVVRRKMRGPRDAVESAGVGF